MKNLIRLLISLVLFVLPWYGITSLSMFAVFVPLLLIQHHTNGRRFVLWAVAALILWNLSTTWWVGKAAVIGVIASTVVYLVLFGAVFGVYNYVWKRAPKPLAYTIFVSCWIAAEYLYMIGEISFPWLVMGNVFSVDVKLVQWYEFTGVFGGSLWILVVNLLIFEVIRRSREAITDRTRFVRSAKYRKLWIAPILVIIVPSIISFIMYYTYKETNDPVKVTILQPNIDPYSEKFSGMSMMRQNQIIAELMQEAPSDVNYIIAPETALAGGYIIGSMSENKTLLGIRDILREKYPQAQFISGLSTSRIYPKVGALPPPTTTAQTREGLPYYYDSYNSAVSIDTTNSMGIYHKSKLVIGVEMLPYHEYLGFITKMSVDLGGISGMLGVPDKLRLFPKNQDRTIGTAICYESLYGGFFAQYPLKGAEVVFVITNDGWWGNTPGYQQHFLFSRLRAIETRRDIARSANTGISALISQRGEVLDSLGWNRRAAITVTANANKEQTFYVKYGDVIGRISAYVFGLCMLYFIAFRRRKKDHYYQSIN